MKPSYEDSWAKVYVGDALECARHLEPQSVHTIVTSPPYFGLRSYLPSEHPDKQRELGAERTPEEFVENLVGVFRALRPALHDSGTLWVVIGDSYAGSWGNQGRKAERGTQRPVNGPMLQNFAGYADKDKATRTGSWASEHLEIKPKDLIGVPFMLAFALRGDGWYWRSQTTWCKESAMPESVRDRPSCATEQVLMFSKKPRYFFDQEAVRERFRTSEKENYPTRARVTGRGEQGSSAAFNGQPQRDKSGGYPPNPAGRNIRNWWVINPRPYPGSHYATFPPEIVYPMIKAGTSEYGACSACNGPWERVVEKPQPPEELRNRGSGAKQDFHTRSVGGGQKVQDFYDANPPRTVGWRPTCSCDADVIPATVLDPFVGSGTTLLAARKLGRKSLGIDLDQRNLQLIQERLGYQEVLC